MYRFHLGNGVVTPLRGEWLAAVHETRSRMIFPELDRLFGDRWGEITCLDAGCNEGYFGFEVAWRGAKSVVGFDARASNIERARFIKDHLAVDNVSFRVDTIANLSPARYGRCALTFCLGLLYHLEDLMDALRRLREVTIECCVIDTQVLRPSSGVTTAWGTAHVVFETEDVIGVVEEPDSESSPLTSVTGLALVPNKSALFTMLRHAGFSDVRQIMPYADCYEQYATFDRIIVFARV